MSQIYYRCHGCGTTHELEHIRKNLYYGQRAIGDLQAAARGQLGRLLIRRKVTRALMRGLWRN